MNFVCKLCVHSSLVSHCLLGRTLSKERKSCNFEISLNKFDVSRWSRVLSKELNSFNVCMKFMCWGGPTVCPKSSNPSILLYNELNLMRLGASTLSKESKPFNFDINLYRLNVSIWFFGLSRESESFNVDMNLTCLGCPTTFPKNYIPLIWVTWLGGSTLSEERNSASLCWILMSFMCLGSPMVCPKNYDP